MPVEEAAPGRRKLVQALLGGGLGASILSFLYPALRFMMPPASAESAVNQASAGKAAELKANTGKIFNFGSRPALLVHTASGEWRAFSAVCTHLNCTVQYREETQQIWCACHNGLYDLNGKVIGGPPPRPLEEYTVHVQGDEVVVAKG